MSLEVKTHNDYLNLSEVTERKFPDGAALSSQNMEVLHHAMGMIGEVGEIFECYFNSTDFDEVNLFEEIGDFMWYAAGILRIVGVELDLIIDECADVLFKMMEIGESLSSTKLINQLVIEQGTLIDCVKKTLIYGKDLDLEKIYLGTENSIFLVYALSKVEGSENFKSILQTNINKLNKRFGDKFSEYAANNRDLDAEREVLERNSNK